VQAYISGAIQWVWGELEREGMGEYLGERRCSSLSLSDPHPCGSSLGAPPSTHPSLPFQLQAIDLPPSFCWHWYAVGLVAARSFFGFGVCSFALLLFCSFALLLLVAVATVEFRCCIEFVLVAVATIEFRCCFEFAWVAVATIEFRCCFEFALVAVATFALTACALVSF